MSRAWRFPVPAAEFDRLPLRVLEKRLRVPWWNLRWSAHLGAKHRFFASCSGRLTPETGKVPCLYVARTRETSFYELYGDDIDVAVKRGNPLRLRRTDLEHRVYVKTPPELTLRVYDLTAERTARAIGMDLATLYAPEVEFPRTFAQRLHDHPQKFDGIQYESRHTQTLCLALWPTYSPALRTIGLKRGESLWDLAQFSKTLPPGCLELFGTALDVAAVATTPV